MNLFSILTFITTLFKPVVNTIEQSISDKKAGATKKKIATDILSGVFVSMTATTGLQPNNKTLQLINQLSDVGIEVAVSEMNNPSTVTATNSATPIPAK